MMSAPLSPAADDDSSALSRLTELAMDCSCAIGNLLVALKHEDGLNQLGNLLRSLMAAYEGALEPMEASGHWFIGNQPVYLLGMHAPSWHQWTFWAAREMLRTALDAQEVSYTVDLKERFWIDGPPRLGLEVVRDAIGILLLGTGAVSLLDAIHQITPLIHFLGVESVHAERRAAGERGRLSAVEVTPASRARHHDRVRVPSPPCPRCGGPVRVNTKMPSGNRYVSCTQCGHQWRCTSDEKAT